MTRASEELELKVRGLYTHPSDIGEVPEGALSEAENVVLVRESIVESRRGFKTHGTQLTNRPNKMFEFKERLLVHHGNNKLAYDSDGSCTWQDYSEDLDPPDLTDGSPQTWTVPVRGATANKNAYFTSKQGVKRLDSLTGSLVEAGGVKALGGSAATVGASGFLEDDRAVAYRIVWAFEDANENLILGQPSDRIVVSNSSGGSRDVDVTFTIPDAITTSFKFQVYRSDEAATAADTPNDEMQLVIEREPTAGEITAQTVTVTDNVNNALRGATLYTSPSQEGIQNINGVPPFCTDLANFKNHMFYANTKTKHIVNVSLISVGGSGSPAVGLEINDTVTVGGLTYTGKVAENAAARQFQVFTAGTPAENIENTARSLARIVNQTPPANNPIVYGFYVSGTTDTPGQLEFEAKDFGVGSFTFNSSKTTAWLPELDDAITSSNETKVNRVYFSKARQPEAVPPLQFFDLGSGDKEIKRIIALRESVIILKEDGIYVIGGESVANFRPYELDANIFIKAPESAVSLNNQVWCLTNQGVITVVENGTTVMSRPIEKDLIAFFNPAFTAFEQKTFAVPYESERSYVLFTVTEQSDTEPTQAYVYNFFTRAWTKWIQTRSAGLVLSTDDKMYQASPDNKYVYQERKDFAIGDHADEEFDVTIDSASGTTIVLDDYTNAVVGYTLKQGKFEAVLTAVDAGSPGSITVDKSKSYAAGAAKLFKPISVKVTTVPKHTKHPGMIKHYQDIKFIFNDATFDVVTATFQTNWTREKVTVDLEASDAGTWGLFPWGGVPWGGGVGDKQIIRTYFPRKAERAVWQNITLSNAKAFTRFGLTGLSIKFKYVEGKFK